MRLYFTDIPWWSCTCILYVSFSSTTMSCVQLIFQPVMTRLDRTCNLNFITSWILWKSMGIYFLQMLLTICAQDVTKQLWYVIVKRYILHSVGSFSEAGYLLWHSILCCSFLFLVQSFHLNNQPFTKTLQLFHLLFLSLWQCKWSYWSCQKGSELCSECIECLHVIQRSWQKSLIRGFKQHRFEYKD